jgi:hypothetical protein
MALGTAHIHLLDTQSFSDYSPPIRDRRFSNSCPLEKEIVAGGGYSTTLIATGKTESVPEAGIPKCLKPNSFCAQNALPHRCAQFGPNSKDTDAFEAEWS